MLTRSEIANSILAGVLASNNMYESLTGGDWISDSGVEPVMSVYVASALDSAVKRKGEEAYVTLETTFQEIDKWAAARPQRGRPLASQRPARRIDVVYWDKLSQPRALIELKRVWNAQTVGSDLDKLKDLLTVNGHSRNGTLRYAYAAFFVPIPADSRLTYHSHLKKLRAILREWYEGEPSIRWAMYTTPERRPNRTMLKKNSDLKGWSYGAVCISMTLAKR